MTPLGLLVAARARIADPRRWCQWAIARDADDLSTGVTSPGAVRWCAVGAIYAESGGHAVSDWAAEEALRTTLGGLSVTAYNDRASHADVLRVYDRTIARLGGGQR